MGLIATRTPNAVAQYYLWNIQQAQCANLRNAIKHANSSQEFG